MLTIYLIDRGGNKKKSISSVANLEPKIIEKSKGTPCSSFANCSTDWYMILFTDEYLEEKLCDAIPFFLESDYEYFDIYRCMDDGKTQRFFKSPRIFRKDIILNRQGFPEKDKVGTAILDGFIMYNDNIS
jgi:hypothetical protein